MMTLDPRKIKDWGITKIKLSLVFLVCTYVCQEKGNTIYTFFRQVSVKKKERFDNRDSSTIN